MKQPCMAMVSKLSNEMTSRRHIMTLNMCTENSMISSRGSPNLSNFHSIANNVNMNATVKATDSEVTIYRKAIPRSKAYGRRVSSSDEDIDSSTEMVDLNQIVNSISIVGSRRNSQGDPDDLADPVPGPSQGHRREE